MKSQMGIESGGSKGSCGTHDGGTKTMFDADWGAISFALPHNAARALTEHTHHHNRYISDVTNRFRYEQLGNEALRKMQHERKLAEAQRE
jgi:hypothetical protein